MKRGFVSAFSLIEVTLALGVATFCLVAIFGLLPIGINSNQASVEQTAAATITKAVVADLLAAPVTTGTNPVSPLFGFNIPTAGNGGAVASPQTVYFAESGNATGAVGKDPVRSGVGPIDTTISRYRVSVAFTPPDAGLKAATTVRILVTWPALADPTPSIWPAHFTGSYEVVTALNSN